MTFLFLGLSKVKIFPSANVHTKNIILKGALTLQNTLPGKWGTSKSGQHMIKGPLFKLPPFGWDPTYFILNALPQSNRIQKLKERRNHIHLPIIH
jgi:hypothetical protein